MGLTLVEKIISEHAGKDVKAGELVIAKVDVCAVQDGTGPLTVAEFKKIGKPDADKMEFWTKEEYEKFIATIEPGTDNYLMAELLFWTGMREGGNACLDTERY